MTDKTIFRRAKDRENPYVMIDKEIFQDRALSWKAKGLLGYLLSRPDDWIVRMTDLAKQSTDGMASVRTAVKELEDAGYMVRRREQDDEGKFQWTVEVHEVPVTPSSENHHMDEQPSTDSPYMEKPSTENPLVDNRTLLSTDGTKEGSTKKTTDADALFTPGEKKPTEKPSRIRENKDYFSMAAACEKAMGGKKPSTVVGPEGRNEWEEAPALAFCEVYGIPPERVAFFGRQLELTANKCHATPSEVAEAIRAIPKSEDSWRTFTAPRGDSWEDLLLAMVARVRSGETRVVHRIQNR